LKTSLIKIRTAYGVHETELGPGSVELTGKKGTGKSSVLDAIRLALTNRSDRAYIIKKGADEAEIIIETDTGLKIDRKFKAGLETGTLNLKENGLNVQRPQSFLNDIITPLQLNPVEFISLPIAEQNRIILNLIDYPWDMTTIEGWFGEIPSGVDYKQNILSVLDQIQSDKGVYYQTRQTINSEALYKRKAAEDIAASIPEHFDAAKWDAYDTGAKYSELSRMQQENSKIQRAKAFRDSYQNKLRGIQADRDIAISNAKSAISGEREGLEKTIERLKAEIHAAEDKIAGLDAKLDDKVKIAQADFETAKAKLNADTGIADQYADRETIPTDAIQSEISNAEAMKKHLNEYARMVRMQKEVDELKAKSDALTDKIELARKLPGRVLAEAKIPVDGLTVENGIPLVNGMPLSNLSDGEKLDLCVDVTIAKKNDGVLQIILIDGAERLDDKSRAALYEKCKAKGLQFIATRTTNDDELVVTEL
jgi:DNA repair ATPase RecN